MFALDHSGATCMLYSCRYQAFDNALVTYADRWLMQRYTVVNF